VIKYYSVINAGELCSYGLAINMDRWNALSPEIQKIFEEVGNGFVEKYAEGLIGARTKVIPKAEKKGMKFISLTESERAKWLKKAKPFMEAWVKSMDKKGLPGKETQDTFLKLVDKYNKQVASQGYPWGK
jgi:TRAP-type transport system periplasmic protein